MNRRVALVLVVLGLLSLGGFGWWWRYGRSPAPGGIVRLAETHYVVSQGYVDAKLFNLNGILQSARAVPHLEDGKFHGFLLQSMEPDSIFRDLGLHEKDVLTGVDDIVFDGPAKGLQVLTALRGKTFCDVHVDRGGRKLTIRYEVR